MIKIRITAEPEQASKIQDYLKTFVPNCTFVSNPYPQTRKSKFNTAVAIYMEFKDWDF